MKTLFAAAVALAFLLIVVPTPAEARRCTMSYQKDGRGHSCGARSSTQKRYTKLGRRHYHRSR